MCDRRGPKTRFIGEDAASEACLHGLTDRNTREAAADSLRPESTLDNHAQNSRHPIPMHNNYDQ